MWRTGTNLNHEKKFYLMTAARRGLRAQVPSINLCGQNRNLPAPARRGSTWKVPRARDAHVTRIVCDIVSFLSSMPRPRSFLHGAGLGLGMADDKETKLTAHGTRIVGDVDVAMDWRMRGRRCGHGLENEGTSTRPWRGCRCGHGLENEGMSTRPLRGHGLENEETSTRPWPGE